MADQQTEKFNVLTVKKEIPENFSSSQQKIENDTFYHPRNQDKTLKTKNGSVAVKENGEVAISSGKSSHFKILPSGNVYSESYQEEIKTNIYRLEADDIIINNHKLNNKLYELADFKNVLNGYDTTPRIAGGLTMLGTVLVKTWEPNLKRYVLMRRQVNIPMFSPSIGGTEVEPGLKITPSTSTIKEMVDKINMTGITSYAQLATTLQEKRKAAILQQEQATAEANKKKAEENAAKQVMSMTTLTGQNPVSIGASNIVSAALHGGSGGSFGNSEHGGGGGSFAVVKNAQQFSQGYQWMDPTGANRDARNQCASFASQMMKKAGIDIDVVMNGNVLASQFKAVGAYHSAGDGYQPQPGDLIDWAHHVGIYAGNGQYIARNSSGGVRQGSMSGMEQHFGALWGFGSVAELQKAKGHNA